MPNQDYDLHRLASLVKIERVGFSSIFDPLSRQHQGKDFKLIHVLCGPAPAGQPAYLRAFEHAMQNGWVEQLVRVLLAAGALHDDDEPAPDAVARIELQKITRPLDGFPSAARDSSAAEKARLRVCRITVTDKNDRPSYGTGFLIGPQTVLTNWHVVESLIDANGKEKPGSWRHLSATFDLFGSAAGKLVGVCEHWLVGQSTANVAERQRDSNAFSCTMSEQGFDEQLDFAVIRLQHAEGRARGYYRVANSREPAIDVPLIVFQHPLGGPLSRTSGISVALWPSGVHTRLRHDANTIAGSSGGLVLDNDFELVALHQAGIELADRSLVNAAIPTYSIARCGERNQVRFDDIEGVDPMWCIASTGCPVFGRLGFQELLLRAVAGVVRVVVVQGPPDSGVAFSYKILQDRLGLTEHCLIKVSVRELPSDAHALAFLLLQRCGAPAHVLADIPSAEHADTSVDAWLRDVLLPSVMRHLRATAGTRTVWIVFDDLGKVELPVTSAVAFLKILLSAVVIHENLRIVMLGGSTLTGSAPPLLTGTDDIPPITKDDIERTIGIRATHHGVDDHNGAVAKAQADFLYRLARDAGGVFLEELVELYRTLFRDQG